MQVRIVGVGELSGHVFVVIVAFDGDHLVMCRHRARPTWETPGGHIDHGESPLEAARRELFEEAGIIARSLFAIADYEADGVPGRLFVAEVGERRPLPDFEMAETTNTLTLPAALTYPEITSALISAAAEWRSARSVTTVQDPGFRPSWRPLLTTGPPSLRR